LKVWCWSPETHLLAARAARQARAFDQAESYLRACRQLEGSPDAIDLEFKLLKAQRGELTQVEGHLVGLVLQDHPDTISILEVLTPAYLQSYQLANAQQCVKRWLARAPDSVPGLLLAAQVFERLLNHAEALTCYRRIVELEPDNDDARLRLAGLLTHGHHPQEALDHFECLRAKHGNVLPVLLGLARCRHAMNQPEEARRLLDVLLAEHPRNWAALGERGRLALEFESPATAEKWFRQAVDVMPFEKDVNYGLYQCLEHLGKRSEAAEVLARLKRIEADVTEINRLTRVISHMPHDPAPRCQAGKILLRNGQAAEGLRWLASALQEDPQHAATHQALAEHYERSGERERAAQHRQWALEGPK
jgi:tetratricopeptide (TPR) repeat protein